MGWDARLFAALALTGAIVVVACGLDQSGARPDGGAPAGMGGGDGGFANGPAGTGGSGATGPAPGSGPRSSSSGMGGDCDGPRDCPADSCAAATKTEWSCFEGACASSETECDPYQCDAGGADCLTSCGNGNECVATHYCMKPAGSCEPRLAQGAPCPQVDACEAGLSCVDGVCCAEACNGACQACDGSGVCGPIALFGDPDDECDGPDDFACDGAGACLACGDDIAAPGDLVPPAICDTFDLVTHTCNITTIGTEFKDLTLQCPANWHCNISCSTPGSCENATIECADDYSCTVACADGDKCKVSEINCPDNGSCTIICGNDACENADITCGGNECDVSCVAGENKPPNSVDPAGSCNFNNDPDCF